MDAEPRIGTKIRRARERKRLRQEDVARQLGVSRTTYDSWENDRAYPRSSIGALEDVLGIDLTSEPPRQLHEQRERPEIPEHIKRRIAEWPPEDQDYMWDLLTRPDDDDEAEKPPE